MNKGLVGLLIVAGLLAAAYAYWLSSHKRPIGQQDVISVVLSVDDKGNCVQSGEKEWCRDDPRKGEADRVFDD